MEKMRPVPMDKDTMVILFIIRLPGDMRALLHEQDTLPLLGQEPGQGATGDPGTHDNRITRHVSPSRGKY